MHSQTPTREALIGRFFHGAYTNLQDIEKHPSKNESY